jgi:biotin carboxyl carrier protein
MVPGKKMELNEGIRLLMGQGKIDIPLKKKEEPKKEEKPKEAVAEVVPAGPVRTRCTVEENGKTRMFIVTSEPISTPSTSVGKVIMAQTVLDSEAVKSTPIFHPFEGIVQVVDILVHEGESVKNGQTVAFVEAMKAKHHIKSQIDGIVTKVNVKIGDEINSLTPIIILN